MSKNPTDITCPNCKECMLKKEHWGHDQDRWSCEKCGWFRYLIKGAVPE